MKMKISEKYLLAHCIETLIEVQSNLKRTSIGRLIKKVDTAKDDSLFLDTLPEHTLKNKLTEDYDDDIVLITEEKGVFNHQVIKDAEIVIFADPTDRSKHLKGFIEHQLKVDSRITPDSLLNDLYAENPISAWQRFVGNREDATLKKYYSSSVSDLSGPCCSFTIVKRGELLFTLNLNYITEKICIACEDFIKLFPVQDVIDPQTGKLLKNWHDKGTPIDFRQADQPTEYVTYIGKQEYQDYLQQTKLFDLNDYAPAEEAPGGPLRILYLASINTLGIPGFIMSNGEKMGEWLGWIAFCKFSGAQLEAYSLYPGTTFAKDDILMAPSPAYSIMEITKERLIINFDKLLYFQNPSRYREMILVTHRNNETIKQNVITPLQKANKIRRLL
ncbi:MAG: hypothetical protein HQK65_06235 [Desulfamplus sp.]|nr:hypothetical protein [Desulfamplus sp.]